MKTGSAFGQVLFLQIFVHRNLFLYKNLIGWKAASRYIIENCSLKWYNTGVINKFSGVVSRDK